MKLSTVAMFGAGYVLGTRAGRQRYEQLREVARRVAGELDATSIRSGLETVTTRLEQYAGAQRRCRQQRELGPWPGPALTGRVDPPGAVAAPLTVRGDGDRAVDGATVVRAVVHARLLGLRLLTLDARVVVAPAEVEPTSLDLMTPLAVDDETASRAEVVERPTPGRPRSR